MRVFILEDSAPRMAWFREALTDCVIDWAFDVERGIELLDKHDYDVIFLDHDLCDDHYECVLGERELTPELIETTGRAVARWLGERPEKSRRARIILHSMNESGRESMASCLMGRPIDSIPFNQLRQRLRMIK